MLPPVLLWQGGRFGSIWGRLGGAYHIGGDWTEGLYVLGGGCRCYFGLGDGKVVYVTVMLRSGLLENIPYSLSRWTDIPGSKDKWAWWLESLKAGEMIAFDQRTALPSHWSLRPEDTLGLVWWTKNPQNLIQHAPLLDRYRNTLNITVTGWHEVEKGAPSGREGARMLREAALVFGPENIVWRFSPIPQLPQEVVLQRFLPILQVAASVRIPKVYLAFLQSNDLMTEQRSPEGKLSVLRNLGKRAQDVGVQVVLCNDDAGALTEVLPGIEAGICVPPTTFSGPMPAVDGCGCVMMVDPFTINESCSYGCQFCYAGDKSLSPRKHNTTRHLPVIR